MDQFLKDLFKDLERYIAENWTGEEKEPGRYDDRADRMDGWTKHCIQDIYLWKDPEEEELTKGGDDGNLLSSPSSLESLLLEVGSSFHEILFDRIRQSGMTDVEVYKRANMDRKLFSKIRNNPAYHPRKDTVLALAIALRLDIRQTEDLLSRAEYALSPGSKSDVIIRYFIERSVFDIHVINIALHDHGLSILE